MNPLDPAAIRTAVGRLFPGSQVQSVRPFGVDEAAADSATQKGIGYGKPIRVTLRDARGSVHDVVVHVAGSDDFGHDRRADRAQEMLLSYDTFSSVPGQAAALDVGTLLEDGAFVSLRDSGEFYLITEYVEGRLYADDLRRVSQSREAVPADIERAEALARLLAKIHSQNGGRPSVYTRAIRDLVGHGEGIFGLIDGFPPDTPAASLERLQALERKCVDWRWRLRHYSHRLTVTHGDCHPFNIVFDQQDAPALLDASRGCQGDAADDVICLAVNYVFFALEHPGSWKNGHRKLWRAFWSEYMRLTNDTELLEVAPPFLAWRLLVLANPQWYPTVPPANRDSLLSLAERCLDAERVDLDDVEGMFS